MKTQQKSINVRNKQARNYELKTTYVAGIALTGREVKLAKQNQVNLAGSHVKMIGREALLVGAAFGTDFTSKDVPAANQRSQKLLLKKRELFALQQAAMQKQHILPVRFFSSHGFVKVEIAIGKIRKQYDKRQILKKREMSRTTQQI